MSAQYGAIHLAWSVKLNIQGNHWLASLRQFLPIMGNQLRVMAHSLPFYWFMVAVVKLFLHGQSIGPNVDIVPWRWILVEMAH